jgi:hypothetical protein
VVPLVGQEVRPVEEGRLHRALQHLADGAPQQLLLEVRELLLGLLDLRRLRR